MSNATNRKSLIHNPALVKDVFSADDLPNVVLAADGVMRRPLELGIQYLVHASFEWPRILMPVTQPPEAVPNDVDYEVVITSIKGATQNVLMLMDGDDTPHIWGREVGTIRFEDVLVVDSSNGGAGRGTMLFDLVGQGPDEAPLNPQGGMFLATTGLLSFKSLGRLVDMRVGLVDSAFAFVEQGLVTRSNTAKFPQILTGMLNLQFAAMKAPMLSFQGQQSVLSITTGAITVRPTDSTFAIDSAATGTYEFLGVSYGGVAESGNFFRPGTSKAITGFANADIAFASVSDSAEDPGVDSTINFAGIQTFVRGQVVLIDGVGATYDGTFTIVRVAEDQKSFDINVAFVATDTGNVKITRVTSVANGLVVGETQTISGTTSYNQTSEVLFRVDDDNFDIPIAFVADDATGTVVSTGKDETTIGVGVSSCGQQPSSRSIGGCHVTNGTRTTALSTLVWTDLDLTGNLAVANSDIQRWSLTDTTTGELRYDGSAPFSGNILCTVTFLGFANQDSYSFRGLLNGVTHLEGIVASASTNQQSRALTLLVPVNDLVADDVVRIQVRNTTGNSDIIIRQLNFTIS